MSAFDAVDGSFTRLPRSSSEMSPWISKGQFPAEENEPLESIEKDGTRDTPTFEE
jgi:hypothetical protein